MFSQGDSVQFVFANENDVYFVGGLLAFDLNSYLWYKLHEERFSSVFFLDIGENVRIRTFKDRAAQAHLPDNITGRGAFSNRARVKNLGKWIEKQLTQRIQERSAIVCPLADFCRYFSDPIWKGIFSEIVGSNKLTGKIILTVSPDAEDSKDLILTSPVFDFLDKRDILRLRDADLCDMYGVLLKGNPGGYQFLNVYTKERLSCLVKRLMAEKTERLDQFDLLGQITGYLYTFLNSPGFAKKEREDAPLDESLPENPKTFRSVYSALKRDAVWNRMMVRTLEYASAGGAERAARELGFENPDDCILSPGIQRRAGTYAERCLAIKEMGSKSENSELSDMYLGQIKREALSVKNKSENKLIVEKVELLLSSLHQSAIDGDRQTRDIVLSSISFCLKWVCVEAGGEEEKSILSIIEKLFNYIKCSEVFFTRSRELRLFTASTSAVAEHTKAQLVSSVEASRKMLEQYEDIVRAAMIKTSVDSSSSTVKELADNMAEMLKGDSVSRKEKNHPSRKEKKKVYPEKEKSEEEKLRDIPDTPAPEEPEPEEDDSFDYALRDEDFGYIPPQN